MLKWLISVFVQVSAFCLRLAASRAFGHNRRSDAVSAPRFSGTPWTGRGALDAGSGRRCVGPRPAWSRSGALWRGFRAVGVPVGRGGAGNRL